MNNNGKSPVNSTEQQTCSVQLRLRRVTYEDAYVSVLVSDKVMREKEDGNSEIDWPKMLAEATRVSLMPGTEWQIESSVIEPHPLQSPRPNDRTVIDSFYLPDEQ